jgi:hypothetical protein
MDRFNFRTMALLAVAGLLTCVAVLSRSALAQAPGRAGASAGSGGRGPRYVEPLPYNFNDHSGGDWQSMFDGSTLKDWDGSTDVWKVQNGAIVADIKATDTFPSMYLYWKGGTPAGDLKNFEFKTEVKVEGEGANSGIQFRALRLGPSTGKYTQWESRGYQADWDTANTQTGALIECCSGPRRGVPPRPDKASVGQVLRMALTENDKPTVLASTGDPRELLKFVHVGDWNEVHLIARGNIMMYIINGHLMSEMIDDNPKMFVSHGELSVQLEGRGDRKVSYRNLWLKTLP